MCKYRLDLAMCRLWCWGLRSEKVSEGLTERSCCARSTEHGPKRIAVSIIARGDNMAPVMLYFGEVCRCPVWVTGLAAHRANGPTDSCKGEWPVLLVEARACDQEVYGWSCLKSGCDGGCRRVVVACGGV